MKIYQTTLPSFLCIFLTLNLFSQSPEWNLDFEEWDLNDTTPDLWHDTTIIENRVGLFPPKWHYRPDHIPEGTGLGQSTDATTGDYAVTMSGFYQYEVMRIISGESAEKPGWPIDIKPDKLTGDYKAILVESNCDSLRAYVDVFLTKYNSVIASRDTIGAGSIILDETSNSYIQFQVDITYIENTSLPDSVIIVLAKQRSGFDSPPPCLECGHVFYDNLQFTSITSTTDINDIKKDIKIFPNPTRQYFLIKSICNDCVFNIILTNTNGQSIRKYENVRNEITIYTNDLPKGIFFLKVEDVATKEYRYEKVIIQ